MALDQEDYEAVYLAMAITCSLSIIGSLFVCFAFILLKDLRVFAFRLVSYLAFTDMCSALVLIFPNNGSTDTACKIQSALSSYFTFSETLFTSVIAHALYSAVIAHKNIEVYHKKYLLYGFGIPIVPATIPWIGDHYGFSGGWCWIKGDDYYEIILQYALFYIPLWLVLAYITYVHAKVIKQIGSDAATSNKEALLRKKLVRKLKLYPLVLLICQTPISIYRVFSSIQHWTGELYEDPTLVIIILGGVSLCSHGFLNSLVYGFTGAVRKKIKQFICRKKRTPTEDSMMYEILKDDSTSPAKDF